MAESTIPIDLYNPGQVFACLGLVEATEILLGDATGAFEWSGPNARFRVFGRGKEEPVDRVMAFFEEARIIAKAPAGSPNLEKWKLTWGDHPESQAIDSPFPFPDPGSPATLPAVLHDESGAEIPIDYWGDATRRDDLKFWGGSAGRPGAALLGDAIRLARGKMRQHSNDPFALSAIQKSSFRFDWRRDYVPVDAGFSVNKHRDISMVGFPLVEILAAIGVSHARPKMLNEIQYQYGALGGGHPLDPMFLRAALGSDVSPVPNAPFRRFRMHLDWPGQEGQARCITHVTEELLDDNEA